MNAMKRREQMCEISKSWTFEAKCSSRRIGAPVRNVKHTIQFIVAKNSTCYFGKIL